MTKKELLKAAKEFDDLLNQFDYDYFKNKDDDNLTDDDIELGQDIDKIYAGLRGLRIQLEK